MACGDFSTSTDPETLLKAAGGKLPRASAHKLAQLDRQLNARYRTVPGTPSENDEHAQRIGYAMATDGDVRSTERVWLADRDAWEPFTTAAARLPADVMSA